MLKKIQVTVLITLFTLAGGVSSANKEKCDQLVAAYPTAFKEVTQHYLIWKDGEKMPIERRKHGLGEAERLQSPTLFDQITQPLYQPGIPNNTEMFIPENDSGRIRYEPFFKKMYGATEEEAKSHLVTIYWMPLFFGSEYPLEVTTVNGINDKLKHISNDLEKVVITHPYYLNYLKNPGGTFKWRIIANTDRLSPHSFGMTIDINDDVSNYWQWDLRDAGLPIDEANILPYRNDVPWEIVEVFEKYHFVWGGKWQHYDSMHFEYRPELFHCEKLSSNAIANQKKPCKEA